MADLETFLAEIHTEIAQEFLRRIRSGNAVAADLSAAIRFLKDNGITAARVPGKPLADLAALVPFPDAGDAEFH